MERRRRGGRGARGEEGRACKQGESYREALALGMTGQFVRTRSRVFVPGAASPTFEHQLKVARSGTSLCFSESWDIRKALAVFCS